MLKNLFSSVFGTRHDREVKKLQPVVDEINAIAERLSSVSEEELKAQTEKLRGIIRERTASLDARLAELRETRRNTEDAGERESLQEQIRTVEDELKASLQEVLDEIMPEAFATVKAAAQRLVGTEVVVTGQKLVWDMVPYDVQLIGAIALHRGRSRRWRRVKGRRSSPRCRCT